MIYHSDNSRKNLFSSLINIKLLTNVPSCIRNPSMVTTWFSALDDALLSTRVEILYWQSPNYLPATNYIFIPTNIMLIRGGNP